MNVGTFGIIGRCFWLPVASGRSLPAGHRVRMLTGGGGGYGPAFERDPQQVRLDVLNELVSVQSARLNYGVVLAPQTLALDLEATRQLRAAPSAKPQGITP